MLLEEIYLLFFCSIYIHSPYICIYRKIEIPHYSSLLFLILKSCISNVEGYALASYHIPTDKDNYRSNCTIKNRTKWFLVDVFFDGNSVICAHEWSEINNLICLRHLFITIAVTKSKIHFYLITFPRAQRVQSYHVI